VLGLLFAPVYLPDLDFCGSGDERSRWDPIQYMHDRVQQRLNGQLEYENKS